MVKNDHLTWALASYWSGLFSRGRLHGCSLVCNIGIYKENYIHKMHHFSSQRNIFLYNLSNCLGLGGPSVLFAWQCTFPCNQKRSNVRDFSLSASVHPGHGIISEVRSNFRIEGNIENESCSTTRVVPKTVLNPTPTPKIAHEGPKK